MAESTSSTENSDSENESESFHLDTDIIDLETFNQLLGMDDDEDDEFSRSIVENYYQQAIDTFTSMAEALKKKDLKELSSLGHFLKGSSAAIGLTKVKDSCEKIQHCGDKKDESGLKDITKDDALIKITELLVQVKSEYYEAETHLKNFYEMKKSVTTD